MSDASSGNNGSRSASSLAGSTVLVTGGTGSFGATFADRLLGLGAGQVRIFSRDEAKQDAMRRRVSDRRLRFYLGDVRDPDSVADAVTGADFVFHAAALKQVPSCEFFPMEAVRTNVVGSHNVIEASHLAGVRTVVCLSTDKAVYPVNAMGMTKGLMEKIAQGFARHKPDSPTTVCCVRYGNVMYSRGSIIPLLFEQISSGQPATVTDPLMTRFMMTLADSVELVEHAFVHGYPGDLFVRKAPACTVGNLVDAVGNLLGVTPEVKIIGVRHGEKLVEALLSREELSRSESTDEYFRVPLDARALNYELYFEQGEVSETHIPDYDSDSTEHLTTAELEQLILSIPEFRADLAQVSDAGGIPMTA